MRGDVSITSAVSNLSSSCSPAKCVQLLPDLGSSLGFHFMLLSWNTVGKYSLVTVQQPTRMNAQVPFDRCSQATYFNGHSPKTKASASPSYLREEAFVVSVVAWEEKWVAGESCHLAEGLRNSIPASSTLRQRGLLFRTTWFMIFLNFHKL